MEYCEFGKHKIETKQHPVWTINISGTGCRCGRDIIKSCNDCYSKYGKKRQYIEELTP